MNTQKRLLTSIIAASLAFGVAGCSSDSTPAAVSTAPVIVAPLAAQTATIVINDANSVTPTVTVSTQAADITLAGIATDGGAGLVDIILTATNNAPRILTNLKAVINTVADDSGIAVPTVAVGTSSGTLDTVDYTYFGPAIPEGGSADSNQDGPVLQISGIDAGASTVTLEVTMPTTHPLMAVADWNGEPHVRLLDSATGESTEIITSAVTSYAKQALGSNNGGGMTAGVGSIDGTKIYAGARTTGNIFTLDLNKLNDTDPKPVSATKVSENPIANVQKVIMNSDGTTLYALVNEGGHRPAYVDDGWTPYGNENYTRVVKVDIASMEVTGSVEMMRNKAMARAKDIDVADDGKTAAVVNASNGSSTIDIVDLSAMSLTKTISIGLDNAFQQKLGSAAISGDGSTVYALYKDNLDSNSRLVVVDVASEAVSFVELNLNIDRTGALDFGPDGHLYAGTDEGLHRINLETMIVKELTSAHISQVAFNRAGDTVFAKAGDGGSSSYAFDIVSGALLDTDGDTTDASVNPLSLPSNSYGHYYVLTTY